MSRKYYNLVEILFLKHIELLGSFPEEMVQTILTSLVDGVQSTADLHSSKAGAALDHLFTYVVTTRAKVKKSPSFQKFFAVDFLLAVNGFLLFRLILLNFDYFWRFDYFWKTYFGLTFLFRLNFNYLLNYN